MEGTCGWRAGIGALWCVCMVAFATPGTASETPEPQTVQVLHPADLANIGTETLPGLRIRGGDVGSLVGWSVSGAGDLTGDGFEDLVVGAPFARSTGGNAYVFYGSETFYSPSGGETSVYDLTGASGVSFFSHYAGQVGQEVSGAGDVNNDGRWDLLIGAPETLYGNAPGSAYLIYGKTGRLAPTWDFWPVAELETSYGFTCIKFRGVPSYDSTHMGYSLAGAGSVDASPGDEFLLGAPGTNGPGAGYVVYGQTNPYGAVERVDLETLYNVRTTRITTPIINNRMGNKVSGAGDFNGDGYNDVLVASQYAGSGYSRRAYVAYGSESGLDSDGMLDPELLNGTTGFIVDHVAPYDWGEIYTGTGNQACETVGDVDGDGYDDLLLRSDYVPSPHPYLTENPLLLVYGSDSIGQYVDLPTLAGEGGVRFQAIDTADKWVFAAAGAGDVNSDGYADVLVGTSTPSGSPTVVRGEAYLLFGSPTGFGSNPDVIRLSDVDGQNGIRYDGIGDLDWTGRSVSGAGDFNGDGIMDFLIGAPGSIVERTGRGQAYLVYGWEKNTDPVTYRTHSPMGDAPRRGVGMVSDGSHGFPASRCWIDFDDGYGPQNQNASLETVTLFRDVSPAPLPEPYTGMPIRWQITSNRLDWSSAKLLFRFLTSDLDLPDPSIVTVFQSSSPNGPFVPLYSIQDFFQRVVSTRVTSLGYFTLGYHNFVYAVGPFPPADFESLSPFTFEEDTEGWDFEFTSQFTPPVMDFVPGQLRAYLSDNTNTFGFWHSPFLAVAYPVYGSVTTQQSFFPTNPIRMRADFVVKTDVDDRGRVPQIRLRSSTWAYEQSDVLVVESTGEGDYSPTPAGVNYPLYFTVPYPLPGFRMYFDALNFNEADESFGYLGLEEVSIQSVIQDQLGPAREEAFLDFRGNTFGWTQEVTDRYAAPYFEATPQGLLIRGRSPVSLAHYYPDLQTFGYWASPEGAPDVTLEAGRLYRATFVVLSEASGAEQSKVPTFRLRMADAGLRATAYVNVESQSTNLMVPTATQPGFYEVNLEVPEALAGEPLLLAFDYLYGSASDNDPDIGVILESVEVVSFAAPGSN